MIEGIVNAYYEPVVLLTLQGPDGQTQEIEAVVDTGYNGLLTLPPSVVSGLRLPYTSRGEARLADGSVAEFDIYGVTVLWDGQPRHVEADEASSVPLVGMLLLDRHNLNIDVENGGRVLIRARDWPASEPSDPR